MKNWDYENDQWTQLPSYLKHLPLFTRQVDWISIIIRHIWAFVLKEIAFRFYVRLEVEGDFKEVYKKNKKLLIISNHGSHLDATSLAAAVPYRYWNMLFITAAKDYFFSNPVFTFFSKHCLGAIPIDRKDKKGEAVKLCVTLLTQLEEIWMIFFPEGTRSKDGKLQEFKRGVSIFSQRSHVPILFTYIDGNTDLWPKGQMLPSPGKLKVFVGPVHEPAEPEVLREAYYHWAQSVKPDLELTYTPEE